MLAKLVVEDDFLEEGDDDEDNETAVVGEPPSRNCQLTGKDNGGVFFLGLPRALFSILEGGEELFVDCFMVVMMMVQVGEKCFLVGCRCGQLCVVVMQ